MKAVPTRYKGYHFRSRLEARWAVFFDALDLQWEYEPDGFELPDGTWYLPDFYFPQIKAYGEVKPDHDYDAMMQAAFKCKDLANATQKNCLLLFGMPVKGGGYFAFPHNECNEYDSEWWGDGFCSHSWTEGMYYWGLEGRMFAATGYEGKFPYQFPCFDEYNSVFMAAVAAARSARFEHGQSGAA